MNTIILQTEEKHEKEKNVNRRVDGSHAAWKCQSGNGAGRGSSRCDRSACRNRDGRISDRVCGNGSG